MITSTLLFLAGCVQSGIIFYCVGKKVNQEYPNLVTWKETCYHVGFLFLFLLLLVVASMPISDIAFKLFFHI